MKKKIILASLSLAIASYTQAASFCVINAQDLTNALNTAEAGGDNNIRIHVGTYQGNWAFNITGQNINTVIEGGYIDAACQQKTTDPSLTILDANQQGRPLTISGAGAQGFPITTRLEIRGLTFQNGNSNIEVDSAGGLQVGSGGTPLNFVNLLIERNIIRNNTNTAPIAQFQTPSYAGGLKVFADNSVFVVRNNLVYGNSAPNSFAASIEGDGTQADIINNTFANNFCVDAINNTCANPQNQKVAVNNRWLNITNNIFWGNNPNNDPTTFDIDFADFTVAINNDIESSTGNPDQGSGGNLSTDPRFINPLNGNFRLKYGSPLINQGSNTANVGNGDLDGTPRIDNTTIDLGAYESNYVFVAGFE